MSGAEFLVSGDNRLSVWSSTLYGRRPFALFHVNVNCSDFERSLAFYRDLVGLQPTVRTRPERPQPGAAFGLDEVQWDAWIFVGDDAPEGTCMELIESPPPG